MPVGYPMVRLVDVEGSIRGLVVFLVLVTGFDGGNEVIDCVREVLGACFSEVSCVLDVSLRVDSSAMSELGGFSA
jgi:hypothetical protein